MSLKGVSYQGWALAFLLCLADSEPNTQVAYY